MCPKPVEPRRDDPAVDCARHDRAMRRFLIAGIEVDRCGICGGIWLDRGELEALVASDKSGRAAARLLDRSDDAEEVSDHAPVCPRDGTPLSPMRTAAKPHVECDACTQCGGVYLDAGELSKLTDSGFLDWITRVLPRFG